MSPFFNSSRLVILKNCIIPVTLDQFKKYHLNNIISRLPRCQYNTDIIRPINQCRDVCNQNLQCYRLNITCIHNFTTSQRCQSSYKRETIEKKLIKHMDMWEMEKGVALLKTSVKNGVVPHENIILNLLQQLANLGEVEGLLSLHEFLIDEKLCSETKFFHCLQEAYYNSGRVDEGMSVLRLLYHRTRRYQSVDTLFTLLAVMVIKQFPHKINVIEEFVEDCREMDPAVLEPGAALWKSFLLTEHFDKANELLGSQENIQQFIPLMINDIVSKKNNVDFNKVVVFKNILSADLPIKTKLRTLILQSYIQSLCENGEVNEVFEEMMKAKAASIALHKSAFLTILQYLQDCDELNDKQIEQLAILKDWYYIDSE